MDKEKINIKDLAVLWKKDKRQYVKQSTYSAYALIVENQIFPTFGNLYAVTEADVQSFVIDRLNAGLSQKYVKDILIVLKMIVRFGEKHGYLQHFEWDIKYPTAPEKQGIDVLIVIVKRIGAAPARLTRADTVILSKGISASIS